MKYKTQMNSTLGHLATHKASPRQVPKIGRSVQNPNPDWNDTKPQGIDASNGEALGDTKTSSIQNVDKCLQETVSTTTQKAFWSGAGSTRPGTDNWTSSRAVPVPPKDVGVAANSFCQILPVTSGRDPSWTDILSPLRTFKFYNTLSTPLLHPNTWLFFCRTSPN